MNKDGILGALLSDPEKLGAATSALGTLLSSPDTESAEEDESLPEGAKTDLLCAVKPFLKGKRRARVDQMIRIMALMELAGGMKDSKEDG